MRRAHTGYPSNQYDGYYDQGDSLVESENDRLTEELKGKVSSLKGIAIDIGGEVRGQNKFFGEMDDELDGAGGFLGKAMNRVKGLGKGSHNYIWLYLILFAFFVFFIIWLLM